MPEKFIFQPVQGKFLENHDFFKKMDPYCIFILEHQRGQSYVAKNQGRFPYWNDAITLERRHNEHFARLIVKDKDLFTRDDLIGETNIDLDPVIKQGRVFDWFKVSEKNKLAGEVLIQIDYVTE